MWRFRNLFCLSVPPRKNRPGFVNISPSVVIGTSMERSSRELQYGNPKIDLLRSKLNFVLCWYQSYSSTIIHEWKSLKILLNCFLTFAELLRIALFFSLSIKIHVGLNIYVLTTCTFMFRQVCIIEPSFFNTTSGMHRRPSEGRQFYFLTFLN